MSRDNEIRIMITGDVNLGDHPVCIGHGVKSKQVKYGPIFPFLKIHKLLKGADLRIGNCEVVLSEEGLDRNLLSSAEFRSYPDAVRGLKYAQFDIMALPTNHSLNHGEKAFRESIRVMEENGIKCVGMKGEDGGCIPAVVDVKGISVGILAYSFRPEKYFKGEPCYAQGDKDTICRDIKLLREKCSFVIVSLHWGDEFIQRPSLWQIETAREFVDAGAGIIFGHHPHVLQGIERYNGGCTAYSLGNFICDMWQDERRETVIIDAVINAEGLRDINIIPVKINDSFQPEELKGRESLELTIKMEKLTGIISDETFSEREEKSVSYSREIASTVKKNRYESYLYFFSKCFSCRPIFFYQNMKRAVTRRL